MVHFLHPGRVAATGTHRDLLDAEPACRDRLRTAHDADRVAVMDAGRIIELGTHDELVAAGGACAALWATWHGLPARSPGTAET